MKALGIRGREPPYIPLTFRQSMATTLLRKLDTAECNKVHVAITAALRVGWLITLFS